MLGKQLETGAVRLARFREIGGKRGGIGGSSGKISGNIKKIGGKVQEISEKLKKGGEECPPLCIIPKKRAIKVRNNGQGAPLGSEKSAENVGESAGIPEKSAVVPKKSAEFLQKSAEISFASSLK